MTEKETFGQRLKRLRKKQGMTQAKLGDVVKVSAVTVNRWEQNTRQPRIEEIKSLLLLVLIHLFFDN